MTHEITIRNATIIDGTGAARRQGSVAINGDRIEIVSAGDELVGATEIDATGLVLAPGFIDAHAHDDQAIMETPDMPFKTSQGVTTVVNGNCGISIAPLKTNVTPPLPIKLAIPNPDKAFSTFTDYFAALDAAPAAVNSISMAGHSTLRFAVMDQLDRPASAAEIAKMRQMLELAMQQGAVGLSTGLFYPPAKAAPTDEVIELCRVLPEYNGLYVTHMRDEADGVMASIDETARIGHEAGVPVVISHHKCAGKANHGRSCETLPRIEEIAHTLSISMDAYPYAASSTMLGVGNEARASRIIITWSDAMPEAANRDLAELAEELGLSISEAVERLIPAGGIFFTMDEGDVRRILRHPLTVVGSDGIPQDKHPHPRLWGSFPRVLGHYARDEGIFSLEDAVRRMTSTTARRFGIRDRGEIREGAFADLVLFDPDTISDTATFADPSRPADGIQMVMVNGVPVWQDGTATGKRPGRALRGRNV